MSIRRHHRIAPVLVFLATFLIFSGCGRVLAQGDESSIRRESTSVVLLARIPDAAITPVTTGFVKRAIEEAVAERATCLILELDTPGGLLESTRTIVKDILASRVPVVVYVSPPGSRAASAGVFITLASHIAAMAPGTHIGAAHPVQMGGVPGQSPDQPPDSTVQTTMQEKILNDTVAWVRSIADIRGRNADWAEASVTKSVSVTGSDAVELGVVDLLAEDIDSLLQRIDGRRVMLETGSVTLETANADVVPVEMWWGEQLLSVLSNPNIAFLLLMLGFYGLLFEFYSPGWGISGTLGAICVILAFFGLAVLPINFAGLALIFLGIGLFVAEAFFTSFGILTVGGAVCLILGGIMLIDTPVPVMRISLNVLIPVAIASAVIAFFLISRVVKTHRTRVQTGDEGLAGETGIVDEPFSQSVDRFQGTVLVHGEIWNAECRTPLEKGEQVKILERHRMTLTVGPIHRSSAQDANDPL